MGRKGSGGGLPDDLVAWLQMDYHQARTVLLPASGYGRRSHGRNKLEVLGGVEDLHCGVENMQLCTVQRNRARECDRLAKIHVISDSPRIYSSVFSRDQNSTSFR
jgi:hypothetical protein